MKTELQNRAWSVLPKEFKEEVKSLYNRNVAENDISAYATIETLFGPHNLTSDAEGEEILTVPRSKVQEKWQRAYEQEAKYSKTEQNPTTREELYYNRGIMSVIDTLFGSKCLPDLRADETCNDASNIASSEPKPAKSTIFSIESDKVSVLNYALLKLEETAKAVREVLTKIN